MMILGAALSWAMGTVLLRKWKPPIPQNTVTGWMMLLGWVPLALAAPLFDSAPLVGQLAQMNGRAWFAILYNIFLAGTIAHAAYFTLARTLPVAVSLARVAAGARRRGVRGDAVAGRAARHAGVACARARRGRALHRDVEARAERRQRRTSRTRRLEHYRKIGCTTRLLCSSGRRCAA